MPFVSDWWNWWGLRRIGTSRSSDTVGWRLRRSDWEIVADRSSILLISFPAVASQCSKTSQDSPNSISIDFDTPQTYWIVLNHHEVTRHGWCRSLLHTHGPEGTNDFKQDASEEPAVSDKGGRKTMEAVACIENVRNESTSRPLHCLAHLRSQFEHQGRVGWRERKVQAAFRYTTTTDCGCLREPSTISMAAFDLSRGIGDCTRIIQDVAVALCQPLIGYGVVFPIPKVLWKKQFKSN